MGLILQILSYIFFGAVFLFGMLTYFKDHKMYPLYPKLFRVSVIGMIIVVTLQIFFAIKFPLSLILWVFFADIMFSLWHIIRMAGAKTEGTARSHKLLAILFGGMALTVLVVLGVVSYLLAK